MCGIIGISSQENVAVELYNGLLTLQHRGQDAAGISTYNRGNNIFSLHKDNGLVRDVFNQNNIEKLSGTIGIAHVRYPTAGCASKHEAQPFYVNTPFGITFAHNGNLVNVKQLEKEIIEIDRRHLNTTSDSEILLNVLGHELEKMGGLKPVSKDIFKAVENLYKRANGGYATVCIIAGFGMVAFRDTCGIRPLVFGEKKTTKGTKYIVSSESVALDILGYKLIRDVAPGECICFPYEKPYESKVCAAKTKSVPCMFEYVYLARPDSMIDNISVYKARLRMGEKLAEKIMHEIPNHNIDVVIPIPDSGRPIALELANRLGVKYREGFVKNRYIGRTFIMPGQGIRKKSIRQKLNIVPLEFKDKNVLLVDDSIVRGNTSKEIISMCREVGAKKVFFASGSPEVIYQNVYGIDMPTREELIAYKLSNDKIAEIIGADKIIYQNLEDLISAVRGKNTTITKFETSCFDGDYITGGIDAEYLEELEQCKVNQSPKKGNPMTLL